VNKVSLLAWLWLSLAVVVFILLVVALAGTIEPTIIQIALKVANKEQTQMPTDSALKSLIILTTAIYFIVAAMVFIETRCFVLSTSVTTANRFTKQMKFNLVVFCSNEVVNLLLSTVYVGNAGYLDVLIVVIVIDFLWSAFTVLFIYFTFISAK
jgi:hypothetical protein